MNDQEKILHLISFLIPWESNIHFARLGSEKDGGYIVPSNFFKVTDTVISLGIAEDDSFDRDCANKGMSIYQFDPTIEEPPSKNEKFNFHKLAFGSFGSEIALNFDEILSAAGIHSESILLKMDVEGGEWHGIQRSSIQSLSKISILVGEFHHFSRISDPDIYNLFLAVLKKLNELFFVVSIIPNNYVGIKSVVSGIPIPDCLELTLLSREKFEKFKLDKKYYGCKHSLSVDHNPNVPAILWNPSWFFL